MGRWKQQAATPVYRSLFFLFSLIAMSDLAHSQTVKQGSLLLSPDSNCVIIFDGENLGAFAANDVKKIKTDFGDHILVANFGSNNILKKTVSVKKTEQEIV